MAYEKVELPDWFLRRGTGHQIVPKRFPSNQIEHLAEFLHQSANIIQNKRSVRRERSSWKVLPASFAVSPLNEWIIAPLNVSL